MSSFGLAAMAILTVVSACLPAELDGAVHSSKAELVDSYLPAAYVGVLLLSAIAALSGGGRELLPREQAAAFPISPTTDHLGALLMAPLNLAWLLQAWALIGATAFATGGGWRIPAIALPVLLWLIAATALAQLAAWAADWMRRGARSVWVYRSLIACFSIAGGAAAALGDHDRIRHGLPTSWVRSAAHDGADGHWLDWLGVIAALTAIALLAIGSGAWMAHQVARRPARDELRPESARHLPRKNATSDLAALVRVDRAAIWRSVPIRRGLLALATASGLGAFAAGMPWQTVSVVIGAVASAAALLFGVNAWGLDGKGALWRDSLPDPSNAAFLSRAWVLLGIILLAQIPTVLLEPVRAGQPTARQLVALMCAIIVVDLQVLSHSLRWSVRQPFAVDMRSARATPAPPLTMVGYSARLAFTTTLTGSGFALTSEANHWGWSVVLAAPLFALCVARLRRASREWADPQRRSHVVTTVAG